MNRARPASWKDATFDRVLAAAALAGIAATAPLWTSARPYPAVPLLPVPPLPAVAELLLAACLVLAFAAVAAFPARARRGFAVAAAAAALLALFDQSRLQPWVVQYAFMAASLAILPRAAGLDACRFIIAAIYVWSGLHKINGEFVIEVFPWLVSPIAARPWIASALETAGYAVPFIEAAIGIALLGVRYRKYAVVAAAAMHLAILALLGPAGLDWNRTVWPWNAAMILFLALLFVGNASPVVPALAAPPRPSFRQAVLVFFGVLPALSFFGLWDSYLSSALYSGDTKRAVYVVSAAHAELLADDIRAVLRRRADGSFRLEAMDWAMAVTHAPPYPETRVFLALGRALCTGAERSDDVTTWVVGNAFDGTPYEVARADCGTP